MPIDVFERGDTVQFTWVSSVSPDAAPTFKVTGPAETIVSSITSISSDTTHYYALYTMPGSDGYYIGEWFANKTVQGSAYNFVKKFLFQIRNTIQP